LLNGSFNYRGGGFVKEVAYLSGGYPISPIRLLAAAGMDESVENGMLRQMQRKENYKDGKKGRGRDSQGEQPYHLFLLYGLRKIVDSS